MFRLLLVVLCLPLLALAALFWSASTDFRPADFTFVDRGDIKNLDPLRMTYQQDIRIGYALWEGLYRLDPRTLEPVPGAAGRIERSDDGRRYTFYLRPAARWSNGDSLRAGDFVFAWRRMLEEGADYAELFHYIAGARQYQQDYFAGRPADFASVGVVAEGDAVLRVTLENPTVFFPDLCAFPAFFPQHEPSMRRWDEQVKRFVVRPRWTRPPNLVGNGPYRLESWQFKRKLRLVANEHYWDRANVQSRIVDMLVMENPQSQLSAFQSGAVDFLADFSNEYGTELRAARDPNLHITPGFGTYFYSFNCRPRRADGSANPLADVRVRRALSMAVDKRFIIEHITRMGQPVANTYIPPAAFAAYQPPPGLPFDPAAARALLAEAGYDGGHGLPLLKINFNTEGQHREIAEYIQRQWAAHLGVRVVLDGKELKTFSEQLRTKRYDISRASWIGDYNDPSTFTDKYRSGGGNNDSDWNNPAFDALCDQAAREPDPRVRLLLFARAEKLLLDEAPILPLYHYVNVSMYRPGVQGIMPNPRNTVLLSAVHAASSSASPP